MLDLDLYTIGNIETISQVYKYLVLILGDSFIGTVVKITAIWGLLFGILASIFKGRFSSWIYHFFASYFMFQIFFMPVVRLTIIDTKLGQTYVVNKVPFGVGLIASLASGFSYKITNMIDNAFHTGTVIVWGAGTGSYPAVVDYSKTGYAGMFDYLKIALNVLANNPPPEEVKSYLEQCFYPYAATLTDTELDNKIKSQNLLSAIEVPNSFFMSYNGQTWTCDSFYQNVVVPTWNNYVNTISINPATIGLTREMADKIVDSVNTLTRASLSFSQVITQSGLINAMKATYTYSTPTDINNQILASYAVGRAEEQSELLGQAMFLWAKKVVPFMQNFLEAFFVILFPFLIILILLPIISFGGFQAAIGFLKVIVWVYLFTPILAIIDGMIKLQAINKSIAWHTAKNIQGLTLANYSFLLEQADFFPAIAGFAALSTPLWAWMLLKGFEAGVQGMASIVNAAGSQFVSQEASAPSLIHNTTRDAKEMISYFENGTPFQALSNAGTWMYMEYANPAGIYSSIASFNAHSILERQLGISGTLSNMTMSSTASLSSSIGSGISMYNASGGDVKTMMDTGAMQSVGLALRRSYGTLLLRYDAHGNLTGFQADIRAKSDLLQANMQNAISQTTNDVISQAVQSTWGNTETFQKALQSSYAITEQFLKDFTKGVGIEDRSAINKNAEVKDAFNKAIELRDTVAKEFGLSQDKATEFVAEYTTALKAAASASGGKLDQGKVAEILQKTLSKFSANLSGKVSGSENFHNTKSWEVAQQYANNKSYQHVMDTAISYTSTHQGYFNRVKQEKGSELQDVSFQDLQNFHEQWQRAEQVSAQLSHALTQTQTQLGSLNSNSLLGFIRWLNGGKDDYKEVQIFDRIMTAVANNDVEFMKKLSTAFMAYTMEMQGMKDISEGVRKFISETQKDFVSMVDNTIDNAALSVNNHFSQNFKSIDMLRNLHGVNPNQDISGEVRKLFGTVNQHQKQIEGGINAGKGSIKPIGRPAWTNEVEKYTKDPTNPIELGKNAIDYGKNHSNWGAGMLAGTGVSLLGVASDYLPLAKDLFGKMKSGASKVLTTVKNAEAVGEMGTGRWLETAAMGRLLSLPVGTTIGASMAVATAPLAALGGYAFGTWVNQNWGDAIYKNFTEPVLDTIGKTTGLWQPVNKGDNK